MVHSDHNNSKNDNMDTIETIDFNSAISTRYLSYALSTIMSRSLPDVRDGLKPVHRRLLYAMLKLKLDPASRYKKCARVVGDVIGKYHPHGDVAVYDTLVRLAQSFSLRYPLIDGQGNFGSIDGDNAAAMRYTESKMTEICTLLMRDLDKDTVDFRPTYDDSDSEPSLMPAAFPNLLANGSEGIAVGMATTIPPHNLHELCDALIYLVQNSSTATCEDIMQFIKGPDFPTSAIIIDNVESILHSYKTGKGSVRVRARWNKEELTHGMYQIVITEIPYQVQKSKLIEQIANLLKDKKAPLIVNIRDESAENIRIIIEPKARNTDSDMIMESLFRLSALESRIYLNMNVLCSDGAPRVLNILEILKEFVQHRKVIVTRRTQYQIKKIDNRLEILDALKIVYLNIDEVIRIIREEDHPKQILIDQFNINDVQAESILNLRLRALRRLEENQINLEYADLTHAHSNFSKILNSESKLCSVIVDEFKEIQGKFGNNTLIGARKTSFVEVTEDAQIVDISAFVEKEPITVICSKMGWIKSLKGHNLDLLHIKYKEGDEKAYLLELYTTDKILICSASGKFFTILANTISKGKGNGESIKLMIDINNHEIVNMLKYQKNQRLLLASSNGKGFIVDSDDVLASTKNGKQIMHVTNDNKCKICTVITGDTIALVGTNRKLLIFALDEIPSIKRGQGVVLQKYRDSQLSDIKLFNIQNGLSWNLGAKNRIEKNITSWSAKRATIGKNPPSGFPKNNKFHI